MSDQKAESGDALRERMTWAMTELRFEAANTPIYSGAEHRAALEHAANVIQVALSDGICRCVPHNGKGMLADPDSSMWCIHGTPDPAYRERFGKTARPVPRWAVPLVRSTGLRALTAGDEG